MVQSNTTKGELKLPIDTTPIPDPPSQHDTAPIPALQTGTPITSVSLGYCTRLHPIQVRAKTCVWGNSHIQRIPHTRSATPTTYLCYITHATAYPSTTRSVLHSATDRALSRCKSISNNALLRLEDSRTGPLGCWCKMTSVSTHVVK